MMPSNDDFEDAELLETYVFYDGPQFYSASVRDKIFVFLAVADDLWVCKELTTIESLIQFEKGWCDGRELFLDKEGRLFLWKSESLNSLKPSVVEIDQEEVSSNKWHTPAGTLFKIRNS